jgi:N-acylneuraminate cytidylyltransferase
LAQAHGATFLPRKPELSRDEVRVREVLHAEVPSLRHLAGTDAVVVVLLPTSPLRTSQHIRDGLAAFLASPTMFSLVSVSTFPAAPAHALEFGSNGPTLGYVNGIDMFNHNSRRQMVTTPYYPNGALYIVRLNEFVDFPYFYHPERTMGFPMDTLSGIDVDNAETLELVAAAMQLRRSADKSH